MEEEAEVTLTIEEAEVVEDPMVHIHNSTHNSTHNSVPSIISNKVNQVLEVLDQIDLFVKSVERLDIWLWTVITGWIMPIKANIHLQSWQQWPLLQMLASLKISLG